MSCRNIMEVAVHPERELTDELALAIAISAPPAQRVLQQNRGRSLAASRLASQNSRPGTERHNRRGYAGVDGATDDRPRG